MAFWRPRHPVNDSDLSAYVDGALEGAARARVDVHVDACAACREALAGLREVRRALGALPRARAPRSFALREADVRPAPRPAMTPPGRAPALLGGLAAAAFLAFGVLVGVDLTAGTSPTHQQTAGPLSFEAARGDATQGEQPPVADATTLAAAAPTSLGIAAATPEPDAGAAPKEDVFTGGDETAPSANGAEDGRSGLRVAEGALAGVALVAGASLLLVRRRRRA
ncbi:MAG: zf-HC2 domain-containing protein [Chloroflexi bacterium]|nr:zf-HC2 domain-containing protein [Chloroflexota bacterium]